MCSPSLTVPGRPTLRLQPCRASPSQGPRPSGSTTQGSTLCLCRHSGASSSAGSSSPGLLLSSKVIGAVLGWRIGLSSHSRADAVDPGLGPQRPCAKAWSGPALHHSLAVGCLGASDTRVRGRTRVGYGGSHDQGRFGVLARSAGPQPGVGGPFADGGGDMVESPREAPWSWHTILRSPRVVLLLLLLPALALAAVFLTRFLSSQPRSYRATLQLPQAFGVSVGTSVRVRGVEVGTVVALRPSLHRVDAEVEVRDEANVIPLRSSFVANRYGLVGEPLIDITPASPRAPHQHGPRDTEACHKEGKIVCAGDHIDAETGVSVDQLVGLWIKLGRESEAERAKRGI